MADFVAVIRRAVDSLPGNTPENRERVYAKARGAVRRQLENMSPRPSEEVFRKQLDRLEAAIREVEIEHTEALPAEEDNADEALQFAEAGPIEEDEAGQEDVARDDAPSEDIRREHARREDVRREDVGHEDVRHEEDEEPDEPRSRLFTAPIVEDRPDAAEEGGRAGKRGRADAETPFPASGPFDEPDEDGPSSPFNEEPLVGDIHDEVFGLGSAAGSVRRRRRQRGRQLAAAVIAVLVLLGAAYALWSYRASVLPMIASLSSSSAPEKPAPAIKPAGEPAPTPAKKQPQTAAPLPADTAGDKSGSGQTDKAKTELPPGGKFTQRLLPDGTETNPGPAPAGGPATEAGGRSVSAQTAAASGAPQAGGSPSGAADAAQPGGSEAAQPAEVSQKMYLYEERYKDQAPTAATGTVVWSLAKDGSGSNIPVIHGEISVPDKGITALVTIKRNSDSSLPASHLIEVVFALPGKFEGGGIQSVERVSMKQTEQARGDPLIAVPAKITDNFFMIALNDYPQAVETNLNLMKTREWIDIPLTYSNGRRALITLDKGKSGTEVFDKALAAWAAAGKTDGGDSATGADGQPTGADGGASAGPVQDRPTAGSTPASGPNTPTSRGQ